ncbi:enoyl-CoA hydratase/isomerase family protein [bacterium]|nr:enoyl-CoA hydratase/isomerase family protein [bacterium]
MQNILIDIDARGVATLTLNRPEVHNAFNLQVVEELHQVFTGLGQNAQVKVVVLRGQGKSFSAGADVEWMRGQAVAGEAENRQGARQMADMFLAVDNCRCPVVALIQGAALGGGTGLTCAVDIAIAGPKAFFGFTEVRLGIVPAVISPYAIRRLGYSRAKVHFLLGDRIDAATAYRIGLIHYLSDDPEAQLEEVLGHLLAGSPSAQTRIKPLVRNSYELADPTDFTVEQITAARAHPDGREGLSAFLEKRPPQWVFE